MSIPGPLDGQPIDDIHVHEPLIPGATHHPMLQPPTDVGLPSQTPVQNAMQLSGAPIQAIAEVATSLEQINRSVGVPKNKNFARKMGSSLFKMKERIGSANPKGNEALIKTGRVAATLVGGLLYGTGVTAGAAVTLAGSAAAGSAGVALSIPAIILFGGYHTLTTGSCLDGAEEGVSQSFRATGALPGRVRDVVFPIVQSVPLATAALGAGLLEFGLRENVDPQQLSRGIVVANRDLAAHIRKYFPEDDSTAPQEGSGS